MKKNVANQPKNTYWSDIREGIRTSLKGLSLSWRHLKNARHRHAPTNVQDPTYFDQATGLVTLRYPYEVIPVPDHGRYRLHNEMDDCIVCDKCAKVCPVDCIEIEPIRATEEVGRASDGSPIRLYAAKFDIDMAKCCYCGLCTTVCPTECLTMTKTYDYSEFDIENMNYHFANISPEVADEKRRLYEQFVAEKEAAKAQTKEQSVENQESPAPRPAARPVFKPGLAKPVNEQTPSQPEEEQPEVPADEVPKPTEPVAGVPKPRPVFKPTMKRAEPPVPAEESKPISDEIIVENDPAPTGGRSYPKSRPVFKPTYKKSDPPDTPNNPS
ncbi:MAG: 4Fe-4S binding protein [Cytophagaceae bacterium]|nr:4Fe-4S binding protein [Cytophagaceae bacterium]